VVGQTLGICDAAGARGKLARAYVGSPEGPGLKAALWLVFCQGVKQAAEKGELFPDIGGQKIAGAEVHYLFCATYGTTEVVP
jgi:hypothetical protein